MSATTITRLAAAYIAHTGLKESTVSSYAMNDGKRLRAIRTNKGDITSRRSERVLEWFSENWPEDLEWPEDISRPCQVSKNRGAA